MKLILVTLLDNIDGFKNHTIPLHLSYIPRGAEILCGICRIDRNCKHREKVILTFKGEKEKSSHRSISKCHFPEKSINQSNLKFIEKINANIDFVV